MFALTTAALRHCAFALVGLALILALAPASALAELAIGGAATVASGEPVSLRSAPGFDAPASTEVASGTQVTIADGPLTAADGSLWYQVDAWGQFGYLPAYALGDTGTTTTTATGDPMSTSPSPSTGWVDPVTGEWIEPATDTTLQLQDGSTAPLAPATSVAAPAPEPLAPAAPVGTAWITGTDGDGAVCRTGADPAAGQLGVLTEGSVVEVAGGQAGEWMPVNCSGSVGYVNASFLTWEQPQPQPAAPASDLATESTDAAALADPAGTDAPLPPTDVETPTEPFDDDQPAEPTLDLPTPEAVAPLAEPSPEAEPAEEPELSETGGRRRGGGAPTGGGGQAIADFAMQYVGSPYAYAGAGPYAFDCSGFTMFVVQNVVGIDITHDMFTQVGMGQSVGFDDLQPGDLVFFQNTFQPGLSHAGIYIGGGQMVHAENESTGVKVSDINSDYYSSRFYGATRLG